MIETRIVLLTAARTYIGQHTVEIPVFCRDDRFRALVAAGGATTCYLAGRMNFGRLMGTGLAMPVVSPSKAMEAADFALGDIATALREDGFIF